jgi:uncharacterized protein YdaL
MKKYQVTVHFEWNDEMMKIIPEHRKIINAMIEDLVIEHYVVSMETQSVWITINAKNKVQVRKLLSPSPFYKHWKLQINELIVWDGQNYRLPAVQLN